jgi:hypothetical protein
VDLSAKEKVDALRELVKGADDVFAAYTLGSRVGQTQWRPVYGPLTDENLRNHLAGHMELGSYATVPALPWPRTYWVLADFDGKKKGTNWQSDVKRAVQCLMDFDGMPCFVNLSRSGRGAHVRMLFKETVPAWMARRWMTSWLEEAGVLRSDDEDEMPSSFDLLVPRQDQLTGAKDDQGHRMPGNLAGNPLNARHARRNGGTLPLDPERVAMGNFEPDDGKHWEHVIKALESRAWGEAELKAALSDAPDAPSIEPPTLQRTMAQGVGLVPPGDNAELYFAVTFCEFFRQMRRPGSQSYPLWVAMATELHRFNEAGRIMFHDLSALDPRYDSSHTNTKWEQTKNLRPVRCESLVSSGFRCPHLTDSRCNGAGSPAMFHSNTDAELL